MSTDGDTRRTRTLLPWAGLQCSASRVGLGCWPMAGITSVGTSREQSIATIERAVELGITIFDTAYSYGYQGECDSLLADALGAHRDRVIVAHKVGQHWDASKRRVVDGRPQTLISHAKECLQRLRCDQLDLLYLHSPDPNIPIEESAGAIAELCRSGIAKHAGVCNVRLDQAIAFASICPPVAVQVPFNMLQQDAHESLRSWALQSNVSLVSFWVLRKGILAGHMGRDQVLVDGDPRRNYEIYQGDWWERTHDLLDRLRVMAHDRNCTVAQLVIAWTLHQQCVDVVLVGAKTPAQIEESAHGMHISLSEQELSTIDKAIGKQRTAS